MLDGQYRKTLSGQMTYRNLPYSEGKGLKIYLLNEEGEVIHSTFADENGLFYFKNLPFEDSYTIMTEEVLPGIKLIITNQGVVVAVLKSDEEGKYVYLKLPYMGIQNIGQMDFGDVDFTMFEGHKGNTTLTGTMVYRNLPFKKGAGMKIYLLNEEGDIVFTTIADKDGRFVFTNLPYGHSYMIRMEENNEEIKINITNNGKVISVLTTNKAGLYSFTMLPFMDVSELEMMNFNQEQLTLYRGSPGEGIDPDINNALVLSEDNKLAFIYDVLDHKKTILTEIENDLNPTLCPETAELTIKEIDDCIDITIEELLAASEKPKSAEPQKEELAKPEPEPDKKYNASATISQDAFAMVAVYFDFNRFNLTIPAKTILADVITMMTREKNLVLNIHGYSDSKGSDSHNLVLSKNRAKKIYDYLTTNGLAKSRMNTNWYGKEKQAEKCGEECTDNQDQLNRRVEIVPSLY
jgi:outer membrane protein OmpA-like peptidoglycan-associated protein